MGRRGDAYDNAVARSFFATLVPKGSYVGLVVVASSPSHGGLVESEC